MKNGLIGGLAFLVFIALGNMTGVIGIHYPRVIEDEPLQHPVTIVKVEGYVLTLADGRVVRLEDESREISWEDFFRNTDQVEIREVGGKEVIVYGNAPGWICGTPWAQPIRIPLIPEDVYRNRREALSFATLLKGSPRKE